jgi:hypothetical protein
LIILKFLSMAGRGRLGFGSGKTECNTGFM